MWFYIVVLRTFCFACDHPMFRYCSWTFVACLVPDSFSLQHSGHAPIARPSPCSSPLRFAVNWDLLTICYSLYVSIMPRAVDADGLGRNLLDGSAAGGDGPLPLFRLPGSSCCPIPWLLLLQPKTVVPTFTTAFPMPLPFPGSSRPWRLRFTVTTPILV